jgi:phosphoribosylformylglycinamidine cyclo-ligase
MRYRDAGVDVSRSDAIKEAIARAVKSTWTAEVSPLSGGFAGVMRWPSPPPETGLLAATLDGVGTKLHLALACGRVADAAADVVYHGANDLLVHGARPVALLDYVAQSKLDPQVVLAVVEGLARACREVGAVLLGGETAEMPDTYLPGVVDVAGCMIGTLAEGGIVDGRAVRPGDVLLGLAASGLHSNGFSLARRVLDASGAKLSDALPGGAGETLADALLAPHRWYGSSLMPLIQQGAFSALAHVTGGGIAGNLARVIPEGCRVRLEPDAWPRPALMRWLMAEGQVPLDDARSALNLGLGMVLVARAAAERELMTALTDHGERVWRIGVVRSGERGVEWNDVK